MPFLTARDVHIDQPLTNLTIAHIQGMEGFVADKVFPQVPVQKKTDKYYIYNSGDFSRVGNVKARAPRTRPERIGMSLSTDSYSIEEYALATDFDFETLANEDTSLNIRLAQTTALTGQLMVDREIKWADTYFKAGVWGTEYTGVANADNDTAAEVTQWDDYTNSTPIEDVTRAITAAHLKSGGIFRPNTMLMTRDVRDVLVNHPDILARLNGGATVTNTALVTEAKLAEIFGVSRVLISDAVKNTAADTLTPAFSYINTKRVAIFYAPTTPGLMTASAGYIFTWSTLANSSGYGIETRSYTGDHLEIEGIAEEVHCIMNYDFKVVGADLGIYFATIIS
jgi:hypothetical protein